MSEFKDVFCNAGYEINSSGDVWRKAGVRINSLGVSRYYKRRKLNPSIDSKGYKRVGVGPNSANVLLHRIIAIAFIPNPENKPEINHKNGIRSDFRIENLEWATPQENQIHSWKKLNRSHPRKGIISWGNPCSKSINEYDVDGNVINTFASIKDAAIAKGIESTHFRYILNKKNGYSEGLIIGYV